MVNALSSDLVNQFQDQPTNQVVASCYQIRLEPKFTLAEPPTDFLPEPGKTDIQCQSLGASGVPGTYSLL